MHGAYDKLCTAHDPERRRKGAHRPDIYLRIHVPLRTAMRIGHLTRWLPINRLRSKKVGQNHA